MCREMTPSSVLTAEPFKHVRAAQGFTSATCAVSNAYEQLAGVLRPLS
jgi:hypothetical protein